MEPQVFPGRYTDDAGAETIEWWLGPDVGHDWYLIRTRIRGIAVAGREFDMLEPAESDASASLVVNPAGELTDCRLGGELPVIVEVDGTRVPSTVRFEIDLSGSYPRIELSTEVRGVRHQVRGQLFEQLLGLDAAIRPDRLICCVTCQWSDYNPLGQDITGMQCHRGAKAQYLAVRTKQDYWRVPVAEQVPETYRCGQYEPRVPGTGYRG